MPNKYVPKTTDLYAVKGMGAGAPVTILDEHNRYIGQIASEEAALRLVNCHNHHDEALSLLEDARKEIPDDDEHFKQDEYISKFLKKATGDES